MRHANEYPSVPTINATGPRALYSYTPAQSLSLKLVFDGNGVSDDGALALVGAECHPPD